MGVYTGLVDGSRLVGSSRLYHVTYSDGDDEELESAILLASIADNQGEASSTSSEEDLEDKKSSLSNLSRDPSVSESENGVEKWYAYWDADYGRHYYYNPTMEVTQWVMPDNYVPEDEDDSNSDRPESKGSPAVDPQMRKRFSSGLASPLEVDIAGTENTTERQQNGGSPIITEATPMGRLAANSIDERKVVKEREQKDTTPEILTQGNKFINQRTPTPQIVEQETPPNLLPNYIDPTIRRRSSSKRGVIEDLDFDSPGGPIDVEKQELRSSKIKIAMYLTMMLFAVMAGEWRARYRAKRGCVGGGGGTLFHVIILTLCVAVCYSSLQLCSELALGMAIEMG
ncbi:hypothetical protein TrLO_g9503 [Triparma laevis f. longispina]|uniref:WW domain-containing protein n=1 Tax=Triparma laevis f. longispina TaxID=1714387 RepID=A0A9W7C8M5_9STRA|nr:hypothetical protein TrLO_g9503 [Triparma laevis f. longispina]